MTRRHKPAANLLLPALRGRLRPLKLVAAAYLDAARSGHRLPPGTLTDLQRGEFHNQRHLLERADRYGGIFKAIQDRGLIICVIGLPEARRLLSAHEDQLRPASVPWATPFPRGLLRVMEGAAHRSYRQALNLALQPVSTDPGDAALKQIVAAEMQDYLSTHPDGEGDHDDLTGLLSRMTTGSLIRMFFGELPGTMDYARLISLYARLGPDGYEMQIGSQQTLAFEEIRDFLLARRSTPVADEGRPHEDNVLDRMVRAGTLDETALGNLIYMVEIGRFDLYSLFRWMLKRAADAPDVMERMALADPGGRQALGSAFVLEALRLNQSERLIRRVKQRFVFDGFCFPKDAWVRICLWEAHKAPAVFPEPFAFRPDRFVGRDASPEELAPFGLGRHRCPMAALNILLGARFILTVADGYVVHPMVDEAPHRGRHHWEPGPGFTVRFEARQGSGRNNRNPSALTPRE